MMTDETVRGQQTIERIRELERTGFTVLRMKCETENGVYTISFVEDWSKRPAPAAPVQPELSLCDNRGRD